MQLSSIAPSDTPLSNIALRDRLIVALDLPDVAAAETMIGRLGDSVTFYKIGYQLAYAGGLPLIRQLADAGKKVFIDLKLHDIGNTVARGTESIAKHGATFLTVHAYPQTMKAAVDASAGSGLKILAVTVLTSYDDSDLQEAGYRHSVPDLVAARARQAQELGVDGIVCSPEETTALRGIIAPRMCLVTPGVRPAGTNLGDQKRIMTPARAIAAGSDYLVVGRPITEAADPKAVAEVIVADIKTALA
ncbi:orotidine-5'-phosphate decarboxylase [Bradyrhizobium sp. dw_411]|uniref:orotidine-5'-phosphate decarboxylase n=1 Tax=Bradyrhizobium sp. dw_411 TaxID=2720082 RepID=UPI001BCC8D68|nr:orotidine-5'-phosphate decarboxylase [Bradyrhizobium sp. dw_411]